METLFWILAVGLGTLSIVKIALWWIYRDDPPDTSNWSKPAYASDIEYHVDDRGMTWALIKQPYDSPQGKALEVIARAECKRRNDERKAQGEAYIKDWEARQVFARRAIVRQKHAKTSILRRRGRNIGPRAINQ